MDGFPNQRIVVLPRPLIRRKLAEPITERLTVTDAGLFPRARRHGRVRPAGVPETIFIFCVGGRGQVTLGDNTHSVGPADFIVIPPGVPHSYLASDSDPWSIWWFHARGTDLQHLINALDVTAIQPGFAVKGVERIIYLMDDMVSKLELGSETQAALGASGVAWHLLVELALDRLTPQHGDPLQIAMTRIAGSLASPLRVPDIAAEAGVSVSYLGAMFKKTTGGGILAYQTDLRMRRARSLLEETELSIGSVAERVGYPDQLYFSKVFRTKHGQNPSEYRRQTRISAP
jgi:AraC family transcriptional regulator, arabinose operon regulatory protein